MTFRIATTLSTACFSVCLIATSSFASNCKDLPKALKKASKLRELSIKEQVKCKEISKEDFKLGIAQPKSKEKKKELFSLTEKLYKMLALIPSDYPYESCYLKGNSASINAFYDLKTKTIYLPSENSTPFETLVHEATHALQDQHFDLNNLVDLASKSTDSSMALQAVVEGDSVITERAFLKNNKKKDAKEKIPSLDKPSKDKDGNKLKNEENQDPCQLPRALQFHLEFPYYWGTQYLSIKKDRENKSINESFTKAPITSTQILYPKLSTHSKLGINPKETIEEFRKHFIRMLPFSVELNKPSYTDTVGEYTFRCIFREYVSFKNAINGARGWLFDSVSLSEFKNHPGKYFMDLGTIWETEKEATEFKKAFVGTYVKKEKAIIKAAEKHTSFSTKEFPLILIKQNKNEVGIFISEVDIKLPN